MSDLQELLKMDLGLLKARLEKGEALTAEQRRRLEKMAQEEAAELNVEEKPVFASNQQELAEMLGFKSARTVQRFLKIDGCPGATSNRRYNVREWQTWVNDTGRAPVAGPDLGDERGKLDLEYARLRNEDRKFENEEKRGKYLPLEEVLQVIGDMVAGFIGAGNTAHHEWSTALAGLETPEIARRLKGFLREMNERLSLGEWAKKKAGWSIVYAKLRDLQNSLNHGDGPSAIA